MIFKQLEKGESTKVYVTGQKLYAFDTVDPDKEKRAFHFQ